MKHLFSSIPFKTVYYSDALKDEFSGVGERRKMTIDENFRYLHPNVLWQAARFFVYRIAVTPAAFLYSYLHLHLRIVGRRKLRTCRRRGFFIYGNHTQIPGDGFMPNVLTFPQDLYLIVNPDNIAAPGTKNLMMMLGTLPIPTEFSGFRPFGQALRHHLEHGRAIMVYPEAHIWPFYTGIRPFTGVSFRYPVQYDVPSFAFTVTYRRTKLGRPAVTAYVDGPFWGRGETEKKRQQNLHDQVYAAMCARACTPQNIEFIRYLPRTSEKDFPDRDGAAAHC